MAKIEETALATTTEKSTELAPSSSAALVEAEIRAAITVALKFRRNEETAFGRLMKSCQRPAFAEEASYSFPRGGTEVSGPSIYLAREAARLWGNIRYGLNVIADDEESRTLEAWAWDLETNSKVYAQDTFKKLIYRKKGGWIKPDERDLRELTNRRGAILKRNCILELLPPDLIDDARRMAVATLESGAKGDPELARKKIIVAFGGINVSPEMIEKKLGHKLSECSPAEVASLRQIYKSIVDGNSKWADYVEAEPKAQENGTLDISDLKPAKDEKQTKPASQSAQKPRSKQGQGSSTPSNPDYSEEEQDPFQPGGELFGTREPGQEG